LELRASLSLASLFALRMLGLFLILPVFAVHAHEFPARQPDLIAWRSAYTAHPGLAAGPFGMASDHYGRKRIIVIGLLVFALGSFVAAWASDITMVIVDGRSRGRVRSRRR